MMFRRHYQRSFLLSLVLLITLISSCTPTTANSTQPIVTSVLPPSTASVIPSTATPIPSPVIETTATSINQSPVDISLSKECIPIEDKMLDNLVLSGVWLRSETKPYLENLNQHTKYEVPLRGGVTLSTYPRAGDIAISPDRKYLAYIDSYLDSSFKTKKRILRIINSAGYSLPMDYWKADWQSIIGWVDNQNLALSLGYGDNPEVILNPFTGNWKKIEQSQWVKDNSPWRYMPTLDRNILTWSANASTVAVLSDHFIDMISKGGQTTEFDFDIGEFTLDSWVGVVLAPDDQKLFFATSYPQEIYFFDPKKSNFHELCTNDYELTHISYPFWSPDNRFIVLNARDSKYYYCYCDAYDPFDLLVDTQQMHAYKLVSGQYQHRLAWLAQP